MASTPPTHKLLKKGRCRRANREDKPYGASKCRGPAAAGEKAVGIPGGFESTLCSYCPSSAKVFDATTEAVPPAVGSGLEPCAGIDFAKPRRFAGRVTYETASIPSNATGINVLVRRPPDNAPRLPRST